MKILLISSNIAQTPYPVYPLGLSIVARALLDAGHEVHFFDMIQSQGSLDELGKKISDVSPGVVGISIRNIDNVNLLNEQRYIHIVRDIVKSIRKQTEAKIVLGDSGFSLMPEEILDAVGADYGIVGEGETLIVKFVDDAARGVYPDSRCISLSSRLKGNEIFPAHYDSELMKFYLQSGNMAPVQTKRGCDHRCIYCSYPLLEGNTFRSRPAVDVVDDIQRLIDEHDAKYLFFTDSVFNDGQGHYLKVLREMDKRNLSVPWTAFITPSRIEEEHIELMKRTGLKAAELGADAATDTTLKKLGKSFTFDDIVECNDLFARHEITTAHYYMFGCPGETRETVMEGIENIRGLRKTVSFIFMGIRILPATPLEKIAVREGLLPDGGGLLGPVYYIAPGIDRDWLEKTLTDAFSNVRHCVFPPDSLDSSLRFMHKLGYSGSMLEMLLSGRERKKRKRKHEPA
jgi:lipid biosynthesis B12-binding/radical SAM protein